MKSIKNIDQKEITGIIDYLAHTINHTPDGWHPDVIITMAKGGLIPARLLAKCLNINRIFSYGISFYDDNDQKVDKPIVYQDLSCCKDYLKGSVKILLVDDIADTGDSLVHCLTHLATLGINRENIKTCSLFYKERSYIVPDYTFGVLDNGLWVVHPWE